MTRRLKKFDNEQMNLKMAGKAITAKGVFDKKAKGRLIKVEGRTFHNVHNMNLHMTGCDLDDLDFTESDTMNVEYTGCTFHKVDFSLTSKFNAIFSNCRFHHADFWRVDLTNALFINCVMDTVYFVDCCLKRSTFNDVTFRDFHIGGAEIDLTDSVGVKTAISEYLYQNPFIQTRAERDKSIILEIPAGHIPAITKPVKSYRTWKNQPTLATPEAQARLSS